MASDDARIEQAEDDHRAALDLGQGASSSSSSKSEFYMYERPEPRMEIFGRNVHLKLGEKNYRECGHIEVVSARYYRAVCKYHPKGSRQCAMFLDWQIAPDPPAVKRLLQAWLCDGPARELSKEAHLDIASRARVHFEAEWRLHGAASRQLFFSSR